MTNFAYYCYTTNLFLCPDPAPDYAPTGRGRIIPPELSSDPPTSPPEVHIEPLAIDEPEVPPLPSSPPQSPVYKRPLYRKFHSGLNGRLST